MYLLANVYTNLAIEYSNKNIMEYLIYIVSLMLPRVSVYLRYLRDFESHANDHVNHSAAILYA